MLRRLSTRRSCTSVEENNRSIRGGCHDFVSWDSDDGMFDDEWPPSTEAAGPIVRRTPSSDQTEPQLLQSRRRVLFSKRNMSTDDEDNFQLLALQRNESRNNAGIALATEAESQEVMADLVGCLGVNPNQQLDIWKKCGSKPKKEKRKSRRLSLMLPRFGNKKKDKFRASALV